MPTASDTWKYRIASSSRPISVSIESSASRLREVARESVEDEPVSRIVLRKPLTDQRDGDLVRDEVPRLEDRLDLQPERRAGGDRRAEHVAGRNVRDLVLRADPRRLRPLPGSLRAQDEQIH